MSISDYGFSSSQLDQLSVGLTSVETSNELMAKIALFIYIYILTALSTERHTRYNQSCTSYQFKYLWRRKSKSWICISFAVWFCGLSSVPVSLSQLHHSLDISGCDAETWIWIFFCCKPTTLSFKLGLWFSVCYLFNKQLRMKNKLQSDLYCVLCNYTVYCFSAEAREPFQLAEFMYNT